MTFFCNQLEFNFTGCFVPRNDGRLVSLRVPILFQDKKPNDDSIPHLRHFDCNTRSASGVCAVEKSAWYNSNYNYRFLRPYPPPSPKERGPADALHVSVGMTGGGFVIVRHEAIH